MARNDWERGELKLSVKEFGSFKRDMIAFHNQQQIAFFTKAQSIYTALKAAGKGKRNFDFKHAFDLAMAGASDLTNTDPGYYNRTMSYRSAQDVQGYDEIKDVLFPYELVEGKGHVQVRKPKAPKKSAFKMLKQNAEGVPVGHEAGITFVKKLRTVIWSVYENNHAVDRAHDHPTGKEFFKRLSRVNWTRGTGGTIVGNDEYNTDSRDEGRGANYVTARYGVAEKQFKQSLNSFRRGF